jgi:diguanylate cyclase (GGDEF)-like protein
LFTIAALVSALPALDEERLYLPITASMRSSDNPAHGDADYAHRAIEALAQARDTGEQELIAHALKSVKQAAYHWTIGSDQIEWSSNAKEVLGVGDANLISSGRSYANLLDPDNFTGRFEIVTSSTLIDEGEGVAFQIEYLFRPRGRGDPASMWIEDMGRWMAGPDGRPHEVFGVVRQINDRHHRDQELNTLAYCDPLTGMMNRVRMLETLTEVLAASQRDGHGCGLLIAAIDNLHVINDAYGFDIADEVIIAVGRRIREVVRGGDAMSRYSGAKFGIVFPHCEESDLKRAAERLLGITRERVIDTERGPVWAMLAIGGLYLPKYAHSPNLAMARAEEALAEARRLPTDGFVAFKPSEERASTRSLNAQCAAEIVSALKEDRFTLAFQPIIDVSTGEAAMHEGLLRMRLGNGDNVAAVHLIPIAEKLGLVRLIDRRTVILAIDTLNAYPQARLSLNISAITAADPRWFGQLVQIFEDNRDVVHRLTIEITETAALHDLNEIIRFIAALRQLGCAVAIDDFGAGYTSFRNLKVLDVDMVKIDGSFCEDLSNNRQNQFFVRSLIDLAKKFDLRTVAEWVQTEEDGQLLKAWGIDYLQGDILGEARLEPPWEPQESPEAIEEEGQQPPPDVEATMDPATPTEAAETASLDFSRLRTAITALDAQFKQSKANAQASGIFPRQ